MTVTEKAQRVRLAAVRFWERCDSVAPGVLVIKGSQALALRVGAARATQDMDILHVGPSTDGDIVGQIQDIVEQATKLDRGDAYAFKLRRSSPMTKAATIRVHLAVKHAGANLTNQLTVDLGYRRYQPAIVPDMLTPNPILGEVLPCLPLYPIPQHIADKVCAIFEVIDGEESDRYRDLFDLAWIATRFDDVLFDTLHDTIEREHIRRQLVVVRPFEPPSHEWESGYRDEVQKAIVDGLIDEAWPDYPTAVRIVDALLFTGRTGQRWNPTTLTWLS